MTASEIAFLAFGLLLGATGGAAATAVSRARGRSPREVRVTVAPAPPGRRPATLATYLAEADPPPARGGPADPVELGLAEASARHEARYRELHRTDVRRGGNGSDQSADPTGRGFVAVPVTAGRDPVLGGILAASELARDPVRGSMPVGSRARLAPDAPPTAGADGPRASATLADRIRSAGRSDAGGGSEVPDPARPPTDPPATEPPSGAAGPSPGTPDPCAGPRFLARERCAVAERAKAEAAAAAERLRAARRAYDDAVAKADAATAAAEPRAIRAAKEAAQDAFRVARAAARTRAEAEAAARTWLDEINRINREATAAAREAARLAAVVADLRPQLERLATEADAARILAESAEEACLAARQALAECEEAEAAMERTSGGAPATPPAERPAAELGPGAPPPLGRPAPAASLRSFEDDTAALVGDRDREAAIIRLLRGDHRVLDRIVAQLAGPDPEAERRWRLLLADLVDAIIARAIEANALDFPDDDPFWGRFTPAQARDIAAALASLGYRFDGLGGFVDGRAPTQRDLSLAVGYAGLDPMRIRTWPSEAELAALFERVTIAADEFFLREAAGLTLSELVEALGHRADELADLWNAWGRVRPLLLELA